MSEGRRTEMVIIGLTDIHGRFDDIDRLGPVLRAADMVLLAGDITHFGGEAAAEQFLASIRKYTSAVLAVPGNCDYAAVSQVLTREKVNCHADCVVHGGVNFIGLGGSLTTPFHTPGEYAEDELADFLEAAAAQRDKEAPLVLVSHQPPLNTTCDRLANGNHVGSQSVRRFIEQYQPLFCVTGHIHEARGIDGIGRTRIVNPGPASGGGYVHAEIIGREAMVTLRNIN